MSMSLPSFVSRRQFLQSAAIGTATTLALRPRTLIGAASGVAPLPWVDRPMRSLVLTVVNDDPGKFDPDFWLDYIRRAHVDAASWNAGGIVALYPTAIPFHRRNPNLGDHDVFGYLVTGCRKLGIVVTARIDHHATYDDAAQAHPEWIAVGRDGRQRRHESHPELWLTCPFGAYNEKFMTAVMREIVTRYDIDGFNHNRWAPPAICYCAHCRGSFEAASGLELPPKEDPKDLRWITYVGWRERRIWELWDHWDAEVRKIKPAAGILPAVPLHGSHLKLSEIRRRAHTLYLDYQGRSGGTPPWMAGKKGKELRAVLGDKPAGLTFSVGFEGKYRWKDSVQSAAEIKVWVSEGVAHGLRPKVAKFCGVVHDKRWLQPVEELYRWQWQHEKYLRNTENLARVGMVFSQQTARFRLAGGTEDEAGNGYYQALLEARIPTEMVHEDFLTAADIDCFAVLVLPDVVALSDVQCEHLRRYVERGGSIVATRETSLYNEIGERRSDFGLADVFGVAFDGGSEGPMRNAYLSLEHATQHPLLDGFPPDTTRIVHGSHRVRVTPQDSFPVKPLTLIPAYPDLPMEEVYARQPRTDVAEVYVRQFGRGRVIYFPWDIDRVFWEVLCVDHGRLLANAVRWAGRDPSPVQMSGRGLVDLAVWRQRSSLTVHLVNLTNPMSMRGPYRELIPVPEQEVRLTLPAGAMVRKVHLLTAGRTPAHELAPGLLTVRVPSFELHEVVAVDLA